MADENRIHIEITGDPSGAVSATGQVSRATGDLSEATRSMSSRIKEHWLGVSAAILSVYASLRGAISFAKESIEAAASQELAERKLAAALGHTSQALLSQASALQELTAYEDDAVISAQALIAMFARDEEQIKRATRATLDLASAKGMDLTSAADLVSKTLGSSTNALSRYGIEVEGAVGSTERLESLVSNLSRVFGGQAAAEAETYTGRVKQLSHAWGDFKEEIGKAATENRFLTDSMGLVKGAIQDLTKWVSENKQALMDLVKSAVLFAVDAFLALVKTLDLVASAWRRVHEGFSYMAEAELAMQGDLSAASGEATRQIVEENRKKDESWNSLIRRLEELRGKMAQVRAEEKKTAEGKGTGSRALPETEGTGKGAFDSLQSRLGLLRYQWAEEKKQREAADKQDQQALESKLGVLRFMWEEQRKTREEEQKAAERRLELEREIAGIKSEQAALLFDSRMQEMGRAFGDIGGGEIAGKIGMLSAIQEGQDPYTQDFERWSALQDQKILAMEEYGASEAEIRDAYRQYDIQQEQMLQQQMMAMASATFGVLGGLAQSFYALSGNQNKAAFRAMQMFRIAETTIDTYKAAVGAYSALAGIPIVGPALGAAAAAAAIAFGMAQVRAIASMRPGGGVAGTASARVVSAGSASPGSPATVADKGEEEKKASPVINVHIYGNVVDHDAFARELVPSITKALGDNVQ